MQIEIIYVFHNCFILKLPENQTFLFDCPSPKYLKSTMLDLIKTETAGTRLYNFSSHSHPDHFNEHLAKLTATVAKAVHIFSSDITQTYPGLKNATNLYSLEPETETRIEGLTIRTFTSTDLGVAFLINIASRNIFFGGDLSNWNWDELTDSERLEMETAYEAFLNKLAPTSVQVALVNTDPRIKKNWAGAIDFYNRIKPQIFVPMHTFGRTKQLDEFYPLVNPASAIIFQYQKTGQRLSVHI